MPLTATSPVPSPEPAPWLLRKSVLGEAGVDGALHLLGPDAELNENPADASRARVLFVASGRVTVVLGPTHYIVSAEEAQHIPSGKVATIRNTASAPAKVLIITLPAVRPPQTSLVTFG
ncbi:hypothetical protein MASR2M8_04220 [Opitutaceae bacterium]